MSVTDGSVEFILKEQNTVLSKYPLNDYSIITNYPEINDLKAFLPLKLKPLMKSKWVHLLHPNNGSSNPLISKSIMSQRVKSGEILAFRYTECTLVMINCVYISFLPSTPTIVPLEGAHQHCRVKSKSQWPRKLYVYLKYHSPCKECFPGCQRFKVMLSSKDSTQDVYCIKDVPWCDLYVMMGDVVEPTKCLSMKSSRSCPVCNQCSKCKVSTSFCKRHVTCKHEPSRSLTIKPQTRIKDCAKYRLY